MSVEQSSNPTTGPSSSVIPHPGNIESALALIWADILELANCPYQDDFFALGGDSISATQIVSRVRDRFDVPIPLDLMFDQMTVERMAALIASQGQQRAEAFAAALPRIKPQPRNQPLPLSHCQRRMWLVQQFVPESTAYNVPFALRLNGPLNRPHVIQAIQAVWSRHEVFRTQFVTTPDGLRQSIADTPSPTYLQETDLGIAPTVGQEGRLRALLQQSASTPFDLTGGPLWRCHLIRLSDEEHILAWIAHHIIIDLWSNLILAQEVAKAYNALCDGRSLTWERHPVECADHAHWQVGPAMLEHLGPALAYWLAKLKDLTPLVLPTDHPATPHWHRSGKRITRAIPAQTQTALAHQAASRGQTPFMIALACLNVLLSRQARQTDIAIATPIANRQHADTEHIVGSLVNTLVMRNDLSGDPTFEELLDRVKATALRAYAHQDLPFDLLVEKLGHTHRHDDTPLGLSVMLNVRNAAQGQLQFNGLNTSSFLFDRGSTQFPLTLVVDTEQTQSIFLEYADALFGQATAEALVDNFLALLNQVLAAPNSPISTLHWLSPNEQNHLRRLNENRVPRSTGVTVTTMLNERARDQPHAVAVRFERSTVSYAELETQARHIAQSLRDHGIGRGHRVGVCLERSPNLLASVWAIWMTGAAYVPLDPAYPAERLQYMASDAKLALVITHQTLESRLEWPPGLRLLLDHAVAVALKGDEAPPAHTGGDDPAYMIYTSGSTGQPKGVVIPHRAAVNFLLSMAESPGLTSQDRLLAVTTLSFDISVLELLLPLTVGAQVVMASKDDVSDGHALKALIDEHQVTVMQATPATWQLLIDSGWGGHPATFKALVGGEPLNKILAAQLLSRSSQVWNMYGPTETTVWSTCWRVTDDVAAGVRIGQPIANTQVWVLDEHGHQCPVGVPGEIVIGGDGVALGYWERESLTADRFVPDTFTQNVGARMYRTGDLGRWRWDGELEHLGRLDFQIKVRGHRIEPGEIEAQLARHPSVSRAVMIAREDAPGDVRLVAYVVPRKAMPPTGVLREHARHSLPDHMQPQHYVELAAIPLLSNGKVNRQGLPPPPRNVAESSVEGLTASLTTDTQRLLAQIWRELLGADHIQASDNFFDLGGHSLLAVQAIARMEDVTGKRVSARRYIFESLGQLAASYDQSAQVEPKTAPPPSSGLFQRWLGRHKR